ncbi:hypothetical protein [Amniculibacterium sp. G2-70]|uniref:hypothetical protein n=1 Tax=Amniculibacterium sp. G2-70 TaxID=2767188 RepID=UPI00165457F7|nr:hypothetical protein [Amniculibacterium sp. G2-70]
MINGTIINLSSYSFIKKNDILSFLDKKYSLDFSSEELYVKTPFYEGSLSGINESLLQKDTNLIVMLLVNDYLHTAKFPKTTDINEVPSCSFWNTVYSVGIGLNASAAWANYNYNNKNDINSGQLINCIALGPAEHSNVGTVHYVTRAYCCR